MKVHNKVLAMSASIIVFASTFCFSTLLIDSMDYERESIVVNQVENDYKMYIKGDNVIRLLLSERYHSCVTGEQVKRCGLIRDDVIKATNLTTSEEIKEYINQDAVDVVNNIIASDKSDTIDITTNWNNRYSEEELASIFESDTKEVNVTFASEFNESDLKTKKYKVTFDAKNGSEIKEVLVSENGKVKKPQKPTRKGYTFVCWQVDGKKYNFNKNVTKDIELVAKWKKKSSN